MTWADERKYDPQEIQELKEELEDMTQRAVEAAIKATNEKHRAEYWQSLAIKLALDVGDSPSELWTQELVKWFAEDIRKGPYGVKTDPAIGQK